MKLSPRDAVGYFARPDASRTGLLIYGADTMRVALRRQEVIAALIGPNGDDEMRLARIPAADLRKDPAMLSDAIKAQSFFPGPRVAFVESATDTVTPIITAAINDWADGDAQVIITAGALKATSKLRKLFEGHRNAYATGLYDEPPSRAEIDSILAQSGLNDIANDAMDDLINLSRELGPGDFRQTIEKLSLYKIGDNTPASSDDIAACAPATTEAALDDVLNAVAEERASDIGPILRKLQAQGVQPVGLCIGATRHFRALYTAAADPGGAAQGISRMRPPIFGPRRDRMLRQAQNWGPNHLETALTILTDTDLKLRSAGQHAPAMSLVERALLRISMVRRSRN